MYTVEFYKDVNDHCEIGEYFAELAEKAKIDKNARINMNKIAEYILLLKRNGTRIGYPVVRPIRRRCLGTATIKESNFLLLLERE